MSILFLMGYWFFHCNFSESNKLKGNICVQKLHVLIQRMQKDKKCRVCQLQATWSGKSSTRNFGFIHVLLIRSLVNFQSNTTLSMIFLHGFVLLSQDNIIIIICVITITSNIYGFKQKWKLRQVLSYSATAIEFNYLVIKFFIIIKFNN